MREYGITGQEAGDKEVRKQESQETVRQTCSCTVQCAGGSVQRLWGPHTIKGMLIFTFVTTK